MDPLHTFYDPICSQHLSLCAFVYEIAFQSSAKCQLLRTNHFKYYTRDPTVPNVTKCLLKKDCFKKDAALCNKIDISAESIDINFLEQKAKGVSKNHEKLHENLPIFFEQTLP